MQSVPGSLGRRGAEYGYVNIMYAGVIQRRWDCRRTGTTVSWCMCDSEVGCGLLTHFISYPIKILRGNWKNCWLVSWRDSWHRTSDKL